MSGETTVTMHRHSWEAFLNMSLRTAWPLMKHFFGKKENLQCWVYCSQVPDYQDLPIITCQIKRSLLYFTS
jgi:hypothetical protein